MQAQLSSRDVKKRREEGAIPVHFDLKKGGGAMINWPQENGVTFALLGRKKVRSLKKKKRRRSAFPAQGRRVRSRLSKGKRRTGYCFKQKRKKKGSILGGKRDRPPSLLERPLPFSSFTGKKKRPSRGGGEREEGGDVVKKKLTARPCRDHGGGPTRFISAGKEKGPKLHLLEEEGRE